MADTPKVITITYEGKKYTLEFTRNIVRMMERQGFNLRDIDTKPATTIPELFAGAFRKNHGAVNYNKIEKIYDSLKRRSELISKLAEMYSESVSTLFDDSDEDDGDEGNVDWDPSW